jgi:glycosyltransferase involved in cell wall biosynthesis
MAPRLFTDTDSDFRDCPTLLSLNRFEKKKNAALAISSFALLKTKLVHRKELKNMRLMIAGETNSNFDTGKKNQTCLNRWLRSTTGRQYDDTGLTY